MLAVPGMARTVGNSQTGIIERAPAATNGVHMPTAADDPDLHHLFQLLRMLPGPRDHPEFWTAVQDQYLGFGSDTKPGYVFEKLSTIWRVAQDPSPENISYLARYLLVFFAGDNPDLWDLLSAVTRGEISLRHDHAGRWWASDVCETAWTLYVRYNSPPGVEWLEKWRYGRDWRELQRPVGQGENG
jgi:hypothetical protein